MPEVLRFGITSLDELFGVPSETSQQGIPGIFLPSAVDDGADGANPEAKDEQKGVPTTSICIVGPTGTGKSIFALHMASTYLADCRAEQKRVQDRGGSMALPTVLYVSTDLTHNMAQRAWLNFALDRPARRREPFSSNEERAKLDDFEVLLRECRPISLAERFDITTTENAKVVFLDMAGYTAGDDWGFLHKILSLLPRPQDGNPRHLVIIDAIEGFEALAGKLNAFGEKSTRRSRIAQVMRLISGKCHALLVVEQGERTADVVTLDEEFVADTVIRLDSITTRNYERRMLKVEKCRGQSHIRGQHHYSIRSGKGSTTGEQMNPDDPRVPAFSPPVTKHETSKSAPKKQGETEPEKSEAVLVDVRTQSYVQVFHSVHRISRKIMEAETKKGASFAPDPGHRYAAFGIKYLDNMLGGKTEFARREVKDDRERDYRIVYDTRGLPCGSTTALIGDSLTQKSTLGKAFLSRCFFSFDQRLQEIWTDLNTIRRNPAKVDRLWQYITRKVFLITPVFPPSHTEQVYKQYLRAGEFLELIAKLELVVGEHTIFPKEANERYRESYSHGLTYLATWMLNYEPGVAVMLATQNTDVDVLANDFVRWLHSETKLKQLEIQMPGYKDALRSYIKHGTVCRRLEIHSLSSEVLLHIVAQCIRDGQKKVMTTGEINDPNLRHRNSWPIRIVIDDFSSLRNMFPELREDPLLFPSILFHLEREGVTTLIIDTQSGKPETTVVERFETELRQMVQHRLYTWRVPFYGESRVAIAAIPPLSHEYAGIVRELRWETELSDGIYGEPAIVDPHFELYSGLEEGKPQPVPLQVRFYAETPAMEKYIEVENAFLREMFSPHSSPADANNNAIIIGLPVFDYGDMRAFAYLQRDTRLDHSYVFQVDEFWIMRPPGRHKRAGAFQPQWSYLDAVTANATSDAVTPAANGKREKAASYEPNLYADPYELFQLRNLEAPPKSSSGALLPLRRRHFYEGYYQDVEGYRIFDEDGSKEQWNLDRVPFAWDFGFLLCQESAWEKTTRPLSRNRPHKDPQENWTVAGVWRALVKAQYDDPVATRPKQRYVSWRIFAEACKKAAEEQSAKLSKRVTAFDFAQVSPESFSCLLLEVWLSQIYDSLTWHANKKNQEKDLAAAADLTRERDELVNAIKKRNLFIPVNQTKSPQSYSLLLLLEKYWLELYVTWLLLIEIIDLRNVIGDATVSTFELKSKNTDFCAVASRHWYKTATQCPDEISAREPLVAVRLPGRFAVRGDWSLAVSGGSRSVRQAERALDLLSSRRSNVTRLEMGVGLPTRVPNMTDGYGALFTKLVTNQRAQDQRGQDHLDYNTFLKITGREDPEFFWLWRSGLEGYAQCNQIWHRWLNRTLLWWHRRLLRYGSGWINSFDVCDAFLTDTVRKFAPTREELQKHLDLTHRKKSRAKRVLDRDFLAQFTKAEAIAQLRIRVEFRELLDGVKEELRQVSTES